MRSIKVEERVQNLEQTARELHLSDRQDLGGSPDERRNVAMLENQLNEFIKNMKEGKDDKSKWGGNTF